MTALVFAISLVAFLCAAEALAWLRRNFGKPVSIKRLALTLAALVVSLNVFLGFFQWGIFRALEENTEPNRVVCVFHEAACDQM